MQSEIIHTIMLIDMGRMVEDVFRQFQSNHRRCNVSWLASRLNCDRRNVYDIFRRSTIDTQLLAQISCVLGHNFFRDIAEMIENRINLKPDSMSGLSFYINMKLFPALTILHPRRPGTGNVREGNLRTMKSTPYHKKTNKN